MASIRTVLPGANAEPSVVETFRRSFDSSEWKAPEVPSAQEPSMVLGWLGSGPRPARPSSSEAPESQERPTVAHLGAWSAASKAAASSPPPPTEVTVRERLAERVSEVPVPWTWKG